VNSTMEFVLSNQGSYKRDFLDYKYIQVSEKLLQPKMGTNSRVRLEVLL